MEAVPKAQKYYAQDTLRDGRRVAIRALRRQDKALLKEGMHHLTRESQYFRFLTFKDDLSEKELAYLTEIDFLRHVALLAIIEEGGAKMPAGVGRYILSNQPQRFEGAELAFVVAEEFQGMGIGSLLLKHLIVVARESGIKQFFALVLPENIKMLAVFKRCGLPMTMHLNEVHTYEIALSLA